MQSPKLHLASASFLLDRETHLHPRLTRKPTSPRDHIHSGNTFFLSDEKETTDHSVTSYLASQKPLAYPAVHWLSKRIAHATNIPALPKRTHIPFNDIFH